MEVFGCVDVTITEQLSLEQIAGGWVADEPCIVTVGPGDEVNCHFHNVKKAKIVIDKTVFGDNGSLAFPFRVTRLDKVFEFHDTEESALA